MQIQTIPNYPTNTKPKNLNFKSVYPVVHWVKNSKNCFYPEFNYHNAKDLSEKIIIKLLNEKPVVIKNKILELTKKLEELRLYLSQAKTPLQKKSREKKINETENKIRKLQLTQKVQAFLKRVDLTYANNHIARGFYNYQGGANDKYDAIAYIATGQDALYLNELGKQIGIAIKSGNKNAKEIARENYYTEGLKYIKKKAEQFRFNDSPLELHVKMSVEKDENKISDFNISDMKFFPKDNNNPFMSSEWA